MPDKLLLLGDEALAQGALDAGISGAYAYPGTPSTEILEYIQDWAARSGRRLHCQWSANEKTAFEEALGMSYAGKRALVSMKHVGVNVAADPFMSAAVTGTGEGGLLLIAADDPSMHSSQNEQDSRFYAHFAGIPCLEPADQQEAYRMAYEGFALSEQFKLPVMLRIPTRLAHSRADIATAPALAENPLCLPPDRRQWVLIPLNARRNYQSLLAKQPRLQEWSAQSPFNTLIPGPDRRLGIVAAGIARNYLREVYDGGACPHPVLELRAYPLPGELLRQLAAACDAILVLEDGQPLIEEAWRGLLPGPRPIRGRLDGTLPHAGELTPDLVAKALGRPTVSGPAVPPVVRPRPPKLCDGCAHAGAFSFVREALKEFGDTRVLSDIGCYALGALPPYDLIDTCVDMGASITMAKGAADAGLRPALALIGDSTFAHSGITGLLDCVLEATPITVMILDNDTTAMTGGQESAGAGERLERLCLGLGVAPAHLHVLDPLPSKVQENAAVLRRELAYEGVSVIIARRVCIQAAKRRKKEAQA